MANNSTAIETGVSNNASNVIAIDGQEFSRRQATDSIQSCLNLVEFESAKQHQFDYESKMLGQDAAFGALPNGNGQRSSIPESTWVAESKHLRVKESKEKFISRKQWEGFVLQVYDSYFSARIVDSEGEDKEEVYAEIYMEEIDAEEQAMVKSGAVFYWALGYLDKPSGRIRASLIRFRRLPKLTASDIEKALVKANEIANAISWK